MKKSLLLFIITGLTVLASCEPQSEDPEVKVTGIEVSPATLALDVGEKRTLEAIASPSDANNKTVSWTSEDRDVAIVDTSSGEVTAIAEGMTRITATTADGGKTATCTVTVNEPLPYIDNVLTAISDPLFFDYCHDVMINEYEYFDFYKGEYATHPAWDSNRDGKLSQTEAAAVTYILLDKELGYEGEKVASLKGIEYFRGLTGLFCVNNLLTALNVSKNTALAFLHCDDNQLSELVTLCNLIVLCCWICLST